MTMKVNKGPLKVLLIGPFWFHNLTNNSLAFKKFPSWAYEMSYSCLVTLEYGINAQVVINVQVGYFCQKNKHTGLNKHTGVILENKMLVIPVVTQKFLK